MLPQQGAPLLAASEAVLLEHQPSDAQYTLAVLNACLLLTVLPGHLVGQYPDRFKCAGLRNPVLNIALMAGVTDIPDWCFIEAYGSEVRCWTLLQEFT